MLKLIRKLNKTSFSNLHISRAYLSTPSKSDKPIRQHNSSVKILNPLKQQDFFDLNSLVKTEDLFK